MNVYPVLDLKGGLVVRGQGGDRASYKPVQSQLVDSAEPLRVARAFRDCLGLEELYVADLDGIGGSAPDFATLRCLLRDGFRLLVDAGVRVPADATAVAVLGAETVIAALETLPSPDALARVVEAVGSKRVIFSLDLKNGGLLCDSAGWPFDDAQAVAREAVRRGVERLLVLDLAQVGSGRGPGHVDFLTRWIREFPGVETLSGGGVRSARDLEVFAAAGVHGVLVASALHDGLITRSEIEHLRG